MTNKYLVRVLVIHGAKIEVLQQHIVDGKQVDYMELNAFCQVANCKLDIITKARLGKISRHVGVFSLNETEQKESTAELSETGNQTSNIGRVEDTGLVVSEAPSGI